jgi:hypothetical protein
MDRSWDGLTTWLRVQVPLAHLSPNVHIIRCRFPGQELERGIPIASESEWFMERYMEDLKTGRRVLHPEKTFINKKEMIPRGLANAQVWHGCRTAFELKAAHAQKQTHR